MPKISAPTVQEHRKLMNERLVDAAESILRERGVNGLTAGAVAKQAGIARNSIYRYVDSVDDLRLRVLERNAPKWRDEVFGSLDTSEPPLDRLVEFARASVVRSVEDTSHGWLMDLYRVPRHGSGEVAEGRPESAREAHAAREVSDVHLFITNFIRACWDELGVPAPEVRTQLTRVLIYQSFKLVDGGAGADETADALEAAIRGMAVRDAAE